MNNMNSERFLMMPLSGEKIFQCICNAQLGNSGKNENLCSLHKLKAMNTYHMHKNRVAFELEPG